MERLKTSAEYRKKNGDVYRNVVANYASVASSANVMCCSMK